MYHNKDSKREVCQRMRRKLYCLDEYKESTLCLPNIIKKKGWLI